MAAMAILGVILLIVARLMTESQTAFRSGVNQAEMNDYARSVLDFIAKDISTAIADEDATFKLKSDDEYVYGLGADRIEFISIQGSVDSENRASREISYEVREMEREVIDSGETNIIGRFQLMRSEIKSLSAVSYPDNSNWISGNTGQNRIIAENISAFVVFAYQLDGSGNPEAIEYDSTIHGDQLPIFVDVYIEFLGESEAEQIAALVKAGANVVDRVNRVARRYQTRIYFHNRQGYIN